MTRTSPRPTAADLERRRAAVPPISYPEWLPVSQRRDDLAAIIEAHQVVVVAGETGSGKTTQLPKICLELGRGVTGTIAHTQPRRIAARAVAERIAEELGTPLGETVGYQVRFTERAGQDTLVKVMTDGILLAEISSDPLLSRYDTLIVDEAHERSLNIDFLLGYLARLLPRRPELKLIITSATIDPGRFSRHFGDAPVIEVLGRTYPVEIRYRPLLDDSPVAEDDDLPPVAGDRGAKELTRVIARDQTQAVQDAVEELCAAGPGDILVFLSGEREIRDTAEVLRGTFTDQGQSIEILPLYSRLSAAEQHRVFAPHAGRRIVLATNVAETSLTVPGIRYVVDSGTARISRYSHRTKVQRLPIEPISQASANQRSGRCGRVADGICIRLYSEADYLTRPEFTEPEILRTNLASVLLRMAALRIGDIEGFPFVDPPDRRVIRDGLVLLHELGAIENPADKTVRLTPLGKRMARLPLDPRLARMVLAADRNGCVREVLVIAAGLSIQDPRERPAERKQAAAEQHKRFADENSDFLAYLNLWNYLRDQQRALSGNQFRRMCKTEFLHYLRIREWQDVHSQLQQAVKGLGIGLSSAPADHDRIHLSLLAGLLSHLGMRDPKTREYSGARNARFTLTSGSALAGKPPAWVMAGELVETSRLQARSAARIEPEWAEDLAAHLVKRTYSEPHWSSKQGAAMAYEKVTLYGIPIVASRKTLYGKVDPEIARELFIRNALVEGDWRTPHQFFHANRALLDDLGELEHRARRRGLVVDEETLFDFYDRRIGTEVISARHFDSWWKKTRRNQPQLLTFTPDLLAGGRDGGLSEEDFPAEWSQGEVSLPLSYRFEPGTPDDGVTVRVPLAVLNQLDPEAFGWIVPGMREELVTSLIRTLPKAVRTNFVPAPDHARKVLELVGSPGGPLLDSVERALRELTGIAVSRDSWDLGQLPPHLRVTFRIEDEDGVALAEGKDLAALKNSLAPELNAMVSAAGKELERDGLRSWDFGLLPSVVERVSGGQIVRGFPALVDFGDTVAIRVLPSEPEQAAAMRTGIRRLIRLTLPSPNRTVVKGLSTKSKLILGSNPHGGVSALLEDCVSCAIDSLIAEAGGTVRDQEAFEVLRERVRGSLVERTSSVLASAERILLTWQEIQNRLSTVDSPAAANTPAIADIHAQLSGLVFDGFLTALEAGRLSDVERYLSAVARRLDRLPADPVGDELRQARINEMRQDYDRLLRRLAPARHDDADVLGVRWMIEELRVSLFAQGIRTAYPVSEQRILRAIDQLSPR
jgi:ATP-dependent helicase HrpA